VRGVELNTLREQAMLLKAMDRAVSGMRLAESKLAASAHNTANTLTDGFARVQAEGAEARDGGVEVNISSLPPESGPDPVAEIIEQKSAAVMYRANLKVVKTAEEMIGEILDTRG
jgi:flagellar basal body rod protein FlgC